MSETGLFGRWFRGDSWNGWRTVMRAAFALPMSDTELAFFKSIAGGRDPPNRQVRELWCVVGRGGGKDSVASAICAFTAALFKPKNLRPGERATVLALACDRDQSQICLNYTKSFFQELPPLRGLVLNETANGIRLTNRCDIQVATNSFRSIRGRSLLAVVLDECAFYRSDESSNPDTELYAALAPGLARVPGSLCVGISSPHRKSGLLYSKFAKHFGQNSDDVLVIRAPTLTMNPTFDRATIEAALEEDPALNSAEYLAQFRSDVSGWLSREMIEHAVDRGVIVRPPQPGIRYVSFCDPSGGAIDSFTCAVAHKERNTAILDALLEVRPPFNSRAATKSICTLLKSYNRINSTVGDKYAGTWVVDTFKQFSIKYEHSELDKSQLYLDALPLFTAGRVRLLDNKRLTSQLASLERITHAASRDRVDHPRGGHDDCANAVAGALVRALNVKGPIKISPQMISRIDLPNFGLTSGSRERLRQQAFDIDSGGPTWSYEDAVRANGLDPAELER